MKMSRLWISLVLVFSLMGCQKSMTSSMEKPSSEPQEIVRNHAVLNLPVDGFENLSRKDRILAYYLYQAAIAGRDITYDQWHRDHLKIRKVCEQILLHSEGIPKEVLEDVAEYLKLQYMNLGIYGRFNYAKFLPPSRLTEERFSAALFQALDNGAKLSLGGKWTAAKLLQRLRPLIFDSKKDPFSTSRSPKKGQDMLMASSGNFYDARVTMKHLKGFKEVYPNNSKVAFQKGRLMEEVWRIGDRERKIMPGRYAEKLQAVAENLEMAAKYASKKNAKALRTLVEYYKTGDNKTFREYNIAWLGYDEPTVDTINGFIEEYRDPRELKGSWEGLVFFVNRSTSGWLQKVASKADAFEANAPIDEKYKRKGIKPIANMVEILIETGEAGPLSWSGLNLPNSQEIREEYGSKNILLWNARRARQAASESKLIKEFVISKDQAGISRHQDAMLEVLVGFHEALGHASGKKSEKLKGDPSQHLPGYYSWLEEQRADLLALHHAWDPMTMEIRSDWSEEAATMLYKYYPTMKLMNLASLPEDAKRVEEPHLVGGLFFIEHLKSKSIVEEMHHLVDGKLKTFWAVPDDKIGEMRKAVAEMLKELQRIKSEGDLKAIEKLAKKYRATHFDPKLAKEVRDRKSGLGIPNYFAFIFPELTPKKSGERVKDVHLSYPKSFIRQQMRWSGYSQKTLKQLPAWL